MSKLDRDLEALSAYLDGELPADERTQLEAKLEADQDLGNWYEQLRRTRAVLRNTPQMRAPRNYFITPAMVGVKEKRTLAFPVLRFASAFAALLLVLLFIGDFFVFPGLVLAPERSSQFVESVQEALEQPVLETQVQERLAAAEAPEEPPMEEPMVEPMVEAEVAEDAAEGNISSMMGETPMMDKVTPTQLPAPVEEAGEVMGGGGEPSVEPGAEQSQMLVSPIPTPVVEQEPQPGLDLKGIIRLSEYTLLVIAISSGIAAFILSRKYR